MTEITGNQFIDNTRSERATTRFDYERYQLFSQQTDAYVLGRLVNELCFTLQLNTVQVDDGVRSLGTLTRILRSLLARTSTSSNARIEADAAANSLEASCTELLTSEELDRQRLELRNESVIAHEHGQDLSPQYFSTVKLATPIRDAAVTAVVALLANEDLKGFFELGITVDKAIHPPVEEYTVIFLRIQDGRHTEETSSWRQVLNSEENLPTTSEPIEVVPLANWLLNGWRNRLEPLIEILGLTCRLEEPF